MKRGAGGHERGQALVLATAFAALLAAAWLLAFDAGQLVNAKLRLNATADAAAYSAAVWQARSLNYQSYLNRAILANEVAIGQLVSLRSWSAYLKQLLDNASLVSSVVPPLGRVVHGLARAWAGVEKGLQSALPPLESGLSRWNVDVLLRAQAFAHQQAPIGAADLVPEVVHAMYPEAEVSGLTRAFQVRNGAAWRDYSQIRRHGEGELREFIDLVHDSRDGFSAQRRFDLLPSNPIATAPRRGGTELIGEYAWRGADSFALHLDLLIEDIETPLAWGAAESRRLPQVRQGSHGDSRRVNPRTTALALAGSRVREGYRGVPQVRDLRGRRTAEEARLRYVVALDLPASRIGTADRLLSVTGLPDMGGVLHAIAPALPSGRLQSLGTAEIHFKRPAARLDGREELPGLFSPYWQARLAERPAGGLRLLNGLGAAP